MNAVEAKLVAALRDLYGRRPETRHLQAWELQWMMYALNYTDELEDEDAIADAVAVAWPQFFDPLSPRWAA
jgi:hypothetical protein